ncbi:hypothetical protein CK203_014270 [Vitis vinifera]|uniref:Uncharacterized protein n=1 Tax=Vitis vinifera TaxID=29760 RepID=A0A438JHT5_VITVI|nr:hypothetical protein CK203_014270 [Vitis vinifera]
MPLPLEGLPPMNAKELYRFLETLATLVEHQASAIENHAHGQSSSSKGSSFDDFKKLGFPYFLVVDRAIIVKNANEELYQYREQQRKRNRSDGAHDCPNDKKFIIRKLEEENKDDKQKPKVQGRVFAMTYRDVQATSDVVTSIPIASMNFDLIIAIPMGDSAMTPNLVFNQLGEWDEKSNNSIPFILAFLVLHNSLKIPKLALDLDYKGKWLHLDNSLDKWLHFAMRRSTEKLNLQLSDLGYFHSQDFRGPTKCYLLSSFIYTNNSIKRLDMSFIDVQPPKSISWPFLQSLRDCFL